MRLQVFYPGRHCLHRVGAGIANRAGIDGATAGADMLYMQRGDEMKGEYKMKQRMICLLGPEMRDHSIDTQYGRITWEKYLKLEARRIGSQAGRIVEVKGNCLWVNKIAG
jgi:hypothetical protein